MFHPASPLQLLTASLGIVFVETHLETLSFTAATDISVKKFRHGQRTNDTRETGD
jgi:hypothetical protein